MVELDREVRAQIGFQGKHRHERFQFYFRQHWIRLLWPLAKLCIANVMIGVVGYVSLVQVGINDNFSRRVVLSVLLAAFVGSQINFLARFYNYFLYVVIVTDRKIHRVKKTLLTIDDHQSIDMWVLQDIHKRQHGVIQNVLRYGSVILEAQETTVRLHFIPKINGLYSKMMHLRERARSQFAVPLRNVKEKHVQQTSQGQQEPARVEHTHGNL